MVHICAACDDKYSKYLGVLITSILRQTDQPLSFYVLCSGLSPKSQEKSNYYGKYVISNSVLSRLILTCLMASITIFIL